MAIRDEAEDAALGVFGGFVIERSVFKVERQMRLHAVAAHHLDQVAIGQNLALLSAQSKKSVQGTLGMMHRNRLRDGN